MFLTSIARKSPGWASSALAAFGAAALSISPASAQELETFDPDEAYSASQPAAGGIDGDLVQGESTVASSSTPSVDGPQPVPADPPGPTEVENSTSPGFDDDFSTYSESQPSATEQETDVAVDSETVASAEVDKQTYGEDDLIGAAEGVFGKGAEGVAKMIQDLLKDQGEPNGYIVGREAGGAFIFGARYGSGTLFHKVEGERKVYWTGPSVGFDAGANAANTFVLVYNLFDTEDLYKRFPAGEGQAYLIGGLHASYMRKGDIVLIPVRMGAGVRLGVNAGYMKFSKKQRWLPF